MLTTIERNSKAIDRLGRVIRAYRVASGRTLGFAMIKTAGELAGDLHRETAKIAPSIQSLQDLPSALGWRIKRTRGTVAAAILRRIHHRKYTAAGWIPAVKGFNSTRDAKTVKTVNGTLGSISAFVDANGNAHITLINRAVKVDETTEKYGIVDKAVRRVMVGMSSYIKSHLGADAQRAFMQL